MIADVSLRLLYLILDRFLSWLVLLGRTTESSSVIVVACPERAERILQAGSMSCPRCRGRLRPFGQAGPAPCAAAASTRCG